MAETYSHNTEEEGRKKIEVRARLMTQSIQIRLTPKSVQIQQNNLTKSKLNRHKQDQHQLKVKTT